MILLQTQKIARHFGAEVLFDDVTLEIKDNARVGLVGRNGAGKSTLLHIISGREEPDAGRVNKKKDLTLGFLDQHTGLESTKTIWEEMLAIFEPVIKVEKEMREIEYQMSSPDLLADKEYYQDLLKKYDSLQETFKQLNGYGYESEIRSVLHGFRFYESDFSTSVSQLSGGQKTRLALARLLLEKKDLLVLDEPTNHLDIETLSWLEKYLQNYTGALLIVSHDRYFLDKVINEVYEVSNRKVQHFTGNYSNYLKLKAELIQKMWKEYEKQQKEIEKTEDFINRNLVRASTTKRAQSRRKMLDKMDRIDKPQGDEKSAHFSFYTERESGGVVLQTEDLAIGYDHPLANHIDIDIRKTDAIALVGPNGVGKTTLLKTIVGQLPKLTGKIQLGTKVDLGYYDQEQSLLHSNKTVLNELWDEHPSVPEQSIRTLLGSFLFSGDDVEKSITSLSGGEKARVALAKLAMEKNNFLILDEPTNHLDIDSKEVLENALIDFEGTLLFVSHDRYFINRMATKVIEISTDGLTLYLGDYDYYLQKKEELEELARLKTEEETQENPAKEDFNLPKDQGLNRAQQKIRQREIRRLNRSIEELEERMQQSEVQLEAIQSKLNDPAIYDQPDEAVALSEQHDNLQAEQETLLEEWENLNLELETYEKD
ncbi:ABC-F family ATP-binding cassette domain-containing protein [Marinilactibacillus psychrotolerans]|uniref:ABC-F family ATP-binding cassette domain-containing protein n=1 Tax=Marinilactibacillus psychrotolerans TaxID=191770 RepID=A0A511H1M6_9LACT|nr:ABC-F family ATP-binding cassette domain-containing protein [Marinilactibacillus psychrotolerans]TLQ09686.1 ABC-F family ATP-binding cassette domain-containing protein [Marinilactibacillus psychrotolerans]GEL66679.1 ABC transporter ATP-binding protein [Marinilactibacillus psychrotolerans]GEQ35201.1 ATPase component of ABC transporter with duplicated ATPase domains [Marinilactibacillus psychrotolerans]